MAWNFGPGHSTPVCRKQERVRIRVVCPTKCLFNVSGTGQPDAGLVEPDRIPYGALMRPIGEGFIHYVPREYCAPVVADYGGNVIPEQLEHRGR